MLADLRESQAKLEALLVNMDRVEGRIDELLNEVPQVLIHCLYFPLDVGVSLLQ